MIIAIPTDDGKTVGRVFGRAQNFAFYDSDTKKLSVVPNAGVAAEHGAGTGAVSFLAEKGVTAIAAPELGPKAAASITAAGIVYKSVPAGSDLNAVAASF